MYPIHLAAENDDVECLEMLLEAGADVDAQNMTKETAMHRAAVYDSAEAIRYLISK